MEGEEVKENQSWSQRAPLQARWVALGAAGTAAALVLVAWLDAALPVASPPSPQGPADVFSGELAHQFLVNLTSIGPRVAGSYENEVLGVGAVVAAVRLAAAHSSPHNALDIDLHRASGAFSLGFFDGMNNVYRDVQSVVVRVRGRGAAPTPRRPRRTALLLNCHFDTVPDSPGGSDDGAGCAVLLETLRALAAAQRPLRYDTIFLFNGAEENIMQASHAFVTTHKWASSVRAFINVEGCGAGGREVLFQAGPQDPWLLELYAQVPRPFGSSVAQEIFDSGLVPADTDFRIFRDFGGASGVDLAWVARGYVYHTHLDTAERATPTALQHTGDNVLAFTHALQSVDALESEEATATRAAGERPPVYFDVLGAALVTARPPTAVAVALAAIALVLLALATDANDARKQLYVTRGAWWACVGRGLTVLALAAAAGVGAAAATGALLHLAGARMRYYAQPSLLALLYALPAVSASWAVTWWHFGRLRVGGLAVHGWWGARAAAGGVAAGWALLLAVALLRRLRSGFVPLLWALSLAVTHRIAHLTHAKDGVWMAWWCAGAVLPLLQTLYLAHSCLLVLVPLTGRSGTTPLPPDVMMGVATSLLTLLPCSWLLPLVAACGRARQLTLAMAALSALTVLALLPGSPLAGLAPPYAPTRPQRYMVFHVRTTTHSAAGAEPTHADSYWMPHLDANTPSSLEDHVPELARAVHNETACELWPYCGAPYFLPVLALISRGYTAPAPRPPPLTVTVSATTHALNHTHQMLTVNVTGPSHVVVVVSPAAGAAVAWCDALGAPPRRAAPFGTRDTYFFALHDAAADAKGGEAAWSLSLVLRHSLSAAPARGQWATLSVAGHGMTRARGPDHQALLDRMPPWVAPTGWPVHMHLLTV